ncbi:MAG: DUF3267 domain-containing protein [Eubacterium sp.]|nr:DUF3267 domain-containing protein [Eubacterium sp.]
MRTYENSLPEGYHQIKIISPSTDRKDSIVKMFCIFTPSLLLLVLGFLFVNVSAVQYLTLLMLIPLLPLYIILHELIHGIVYLILTGHGFKLGRSKDGFYCILPQLYIYVKTQLLGAAAPFVVFTITLLSGCVIAIVNQSCLFMILSFLLAFHFFACRGDIYLIKELLKLKGAGKLLVIEDENGDNAVFGLN